MKTKKIISLILVAALLSGLCACGEKKPALLKYSNTFFDAFDTVITITAYCDSEETFNGLFETSEAEFIRYHKLFDIYNSHEGITSLKDVNDMAGSGAVKVDPAIIELLGYAKEMYGTTNGKMNVAMGAVLSRWHTARELALVMDADPVPDISELKEKAEHCSIDDLVIDAAAGTVELKDPEMSLDVGAIAKGFATEKVIDMLAEQGATHVLINAGGNVRTLGIKPDGSKWKVGIQNPDTQSSEAYIDTVDIDEKSVVTSGIYERFFEYGGRRYHHIIDSETLFPELRYQSVTIVTEDSALADALSTAVFNMEPAEGKDFINSMDGVEAMWILNDGTQVFSEHFK